MERRGFLKHAAAVPFLPLIRALEPAQAADATADRAMGRVRPTDPAWPTAAQWDKLNQAVGGRLTKVIE